MTEKQQEYEKLSGLRALVAGALLTHLRERHGWNQSDVSKRTGILQPTISKCETLSGSFQLSPHRLALFARLYKLPLADLYRRVDLLVEQLHKRVARDFGRLPREERDEQALALLGPAGAQGFVRYLCAVQDRPTA